MSDETTYYTAIEVAVRHGCHPSTVLRALNTQADKARWFPTAELKGVGNNQAWQICEREADAWKPRSVGYQHPEVNDG